MTPTQKGIKKSLRKLHHRDGHLTHLTEKLLKICSEKVQHHETNELHDLRKTNEIRMGNNHHCRRLKEEEEEEVLKLLLL